MINNDIIWLLRRDVTLDDDMFTAAPKVFISNL